MTPLFSFYSHPICTPEGQIPTKVMTLDEACDYIISDAAMHATITLRSIPEKKKHSDFKKSNFASVTFSGTFKSRKKCDLMTPSGLLCLDFDHINHPRDLIKKIIADPNFTAELAFVSPSGDGAKIVVPTNPEVDFDSNFGGYSDYFAHAYNVTPDQACKDISRACFLPYDPDCYYNRTKVHQPLAFTCKTQDPTSPTDAEAMDEDIDVNHVMDIVREIEEREIDITGDYNTWFRLGCSLTPLGDIGRDIYHSISRYYPGYSASGTDKQFDKCLKSHKKDRKDNIGLGTFYWIAHNNGIDISKKKGCASCARCAPVDKGELTLTEEMLPTIVDKVQPILPKILQEGVAIATTVWEADLILISMVTALSVLIPNIQFIYGGDLFYPALLCVVEGAAAAGKGRLNLAYTLTAWLQQRWDATYRQEMAAYRDEKKIYDNNACPGCPPPREPAQKLFVIPGDSTDPALKTQLFDNEGVGLLVETEAETITNCYATDYGKYNPTFRKVWSHETISYIRKTNKEKVVVPTPRLAALIGGTANQIKILVGDISSGLFSRLAFYHIPLSKIWINPFDATQSINDTMLRIAETYANKYYIIYEAWEAVKFRLTLEQIGKFNESFAAKHLEAFADTDENHDLVSVVRRFGVLCCRFALIFSALRCVENGNTTTQVLTCDDESFDAAMAICDALLEHARYGHAILGRTKTVANPRIMFFYRLLPDDFSRQDYKGIAQANGYNDRTVERYIKTLVDCGYIEHTDIDRYIKK